MKLSKMHQRVLSKAPYQRSVTDGIKPSHAIVDEEAGFYGQWGWEGPNKADKGKRLGSCNVTRCQRSGAYWYNKVMEAWYCSDCAHGINYRPLPDGTYLCTLDMDARKEYLNKEEG